MGSLFSKNSSNNNRRYNKYQSHTTTTDTHSDNQATTTTVTAESTASLPGDHKNEPSRASVLPQSECKDMMMNDAVTALLGYVNRQCVVGDCEGSLLSYDINSGAKTKVWTGHQKTVTKICKTSEHLFTSSRDLSINMWTFDENSPVQEFKGQHKLVISAVASSQDGAKISSGSRDTSVALWDVRTGQVIASNTIARNLVTDLCWYEDALIQASEDKHIRMWDTRMLEVAKTFAQKKQIVTSCDVQGDYIVSSSSGMNGTGCEVTIWDRRGGDTMPVHEFKGHIEKVYRAVFVQDSDLQLIVSVAGDRSVCLWDVINRRKLSSVFIPAQLTTIAQMNMEQTSDSLLRFAVGTIDTGVKIITLDKNAYILHI